MANMNRNDHIRAVVFDVDGTLLDTLPSLAAAANEVLAEAGLRTVPADRLRPALSEGLGPMFQHALALQAEASAAEQASALEASYFTRYAQHWLAQATPYAGVPALLAELKSQGLLLGLCSNRDRPSIEALLACTGLDIGFDAVVGLGDAARPKPAADPLLRVLQQLDVPAAQVLFVGDSAMDARCAEAAGVRFAAHRAGYAGQPADLLPQVTGFDHYDTFTPWLLGQLSNVLTSSPENCHA